MRRVAVDVEKASAYEALDQRKHTGLDQQAGKSSRRY
jgi:hypothetical protein